MTAYPRYLVTVALAVALGVAASPLAQAADGPGAPIAPVPAADLVAARTAAQSPAVLDRLGHFFARAGVAPNRPLALAPADEAGAAAAAAPHLEGDAVAVYTLNAGFVAGTAGAPVARVDFVASKAVAADGRAASVWTVRDDTGWRVVNIASGGDEADFPKAGAAAGGTAFREPQIDAWYVLRDGRVLPLNDEARRSVGAGGATLAEYRSLVHLRYGDKLPGSAYDRAGAGGGYEPGAAPAGSGGLPLVPAGAAALGAVALAGAGLAVRRRVRR